MVSGLTAKIKKILELLPPRDRLFLRLERGKSVEVGRKAVAQLTAKEAGVGEDRLLFVQSALYIYFDCFKEAHQIAQDHEGLFGNWLHAILHRREPDAGNSKYWYARIKIPSKVSQGIAQEALKVLGAHPTKDLEAFQKKLAKEGEWVSEAFVDLCEKVQSGKPDSSDYQALAQIQEIEWFNLLKLILGKT